ncbi:AMP-binding protein, partial [Cephaloticoccus primus]|uniref:AMP-binding protein n=1 Tax=Cephaloticoccus primus TaxID=1548207 RepID=UPI000AE3E1E8
MERAQLEKIVHATGVVEQHGAHVFLCDPHWSAAQRVRFSEIAEQARRTADERQESGEAREEREAKGSRARPPHTLRGWLCIPTGGSSGGLKFAQHDELSLGAAVRGFCAHFGVERVNAVDVLPPWHVSGLMARLRCAATGGNHLSWDWKRLEAGAFPEIPGCSVAGASKAVAGDAPEGAAAETSAWFLSLVPTQLQRLLKRGVAARQWLRRFDAIFIGGGPLWRALADEAAAARLPIILSYGMTETGAMIAAQQSGDFADGDRSSGPPMPHAQVEVSREGVLRVRGESVMRGYWGEGGDFAQGGVFTTADLARIDDGGRLHILGRRDEAAISGGEKVRLTEVEAALRAAVLFDDVAVCAVPDPEWGEAVVACYLSTDGAPIPADSLKGITASLARHQRPRHWLAFAPA